MKDLIGDILGFWGEFVTFILVSIVVICMTVFICCGIATLFDKDSMAELKAWCSSIEGTAYANGHCFKDGVELVRGGE